MTKEFFQPDTLLKALQMRRTAQSSVLLAGGTDLVVAMRDGRSPEGSIVDLSKVRELAGVDAAGDSVRIGSMTTFTEIADSEFLRKAAAALCEAAKTVGSPQIRNRATIGGNICNASAAADGLAPLLCLDADVELQSLAADGTASIRVLPLEEFLVDGRKTALKDNEIMTGVLFKKPAEDTLSAFRKIGRRNALAIARLNGCFSIRLTDGAAASVHFALGAATSKPERIRTVEEFLTGRTLNEETLNTAGKLASEYVLQRTGTRSSSCYKLPVIERITVSLIRAALGKEDA